MKKIFSLFLVLLSFAAGAQINTVSRLKGVTFGASMDSIVTTLGVSGADTMQLHSQSNASTVSIQTVITRSSGNTLGDVLTLYGSLDGSKWVQCADSSVLSNAATSTKTWTFKANPFAYYRTIVTDTGAQKIYIKSYFLPNKQSGLTNGTYNFKATSFPTHTVDTVTNTATNSVSLQVQNWYETLSIQVNATKISGTVGGTITLQGSNDGTNYFTVPTTYLLNTVGSTAYGLNVYSGAATRTAANSTKSYFFCLRESPYEYYRVSWTGTGTMSAKLAAVLLPNK